MTSFWTVQSVVLQMLSVAVNSITGNETTSPEVGPNSDTARTDMGGGRWGGERVKWAPIRTP